MERSRVLPGRQLYSNCPCILVSEASLPSDYDEQFCSTYSGGSSTINDQHCRVSLSQHSRGTAYTPSVVFLLLLRHLEVFRPAEDQPPLTHIFHTFQVLWPQPIAQINVAPLPGDWNRRSIRRRQTWLRTVESGVAPFKWSGNCLSSSRKSAGMEVARGNGSNVHWTIAT